MGTRTYRRKKIWINSQFQAKYTALTAGVAAIILAVLAYIYIDLKAEQTRLLGIQQIEESSALEFNLDLQGKAAQEDRERIYILVSVAAILVVLLGYVAVRVTFRAAGPIYAVSSMLRAMASGDFRSVRRLREGDEFRFLEKDLSLLLDRLKAMAKEDVELLLRIEAALKEAQTGNGLLDDIRTALAKKEDSFGIKRG